MERFFPLNEIDYDASDWQRYFKQFISNGVFVNPTSQLQVIADGTSMKVNVKIGNAYINGILYSLDSDYTLTLDVADGVLSRIDKVTVRYDAVGNSVGLVIKKGTFASDPVAPAITRTADVYELALADIRINKGATKITQADITDLRANTDLCGFVKGLIDEIDTTDLFAQFQNSFNTWFEHMKGQLSEDAAGSLQQQIDSNDLDIENIRTEIEDARKGETDLKAKMDSIDSLLADKANYSQGTWTPTLWATSTSSGITFSTQSGQWVKIGNQVTLYGQIILSSKGSAAGGIAIAGLPYIPATFGVGSLFCNGIAPTNLVMRASPGSSNLDLIKLISNNNAVLVDVSEIANNTLLYFSITYRV